MKFDTGTRTAQRFLTDSRVEGVTTLDGLVWLARSEAGQIAAIDPLTNESVRFDAHGAPNGIAGRVGPNGERWLAFVSGGAWGDPEVVTVHFE